MNNTILLVEDEEDDVFFMKRAMERLGIIKVLRVVEDGQQAINYLKGTGFYKDRERFPLPGLILLDLKLPEVMGLEVLKWIRQQSCFSSIIVVVLTSSNLASDMNEAYRLGANSYLIKPRDSKKLLGVIKQVKEYWLDLNQRAFELVPEIG